MCYIPTFVEIEEKIKIKRASTPYHDLLVRFKVGCSFIALSRTAISDSIPQIT